MPYDEFFSHSVHSKVTFMFLSTCNLWIVIYADQWGAGEAACQSPLSKAPRPRQDGGGPRGPCPFGNHTKAARGGCQEEGGRTQRFGCLELLALTHMSCTKYAVIPNVVIFFLSSSQGSRRAEELMQTAPVSSTTPVPNLRLGCCFSLMSVPVDATTSASSSLGTLFTFNRSRAFDFSAIHFVLLLYLTHRRFRIKINTLPRGRFHFLLSHNSHKMYPESILSFVVGVFNFENANFGVEPCVRNNSVLLSDRDPEMLNEYACWALILAYYRTSFFRFFFGNNKAIFMSS